MTSICRKNGLILSLCLMAGTLTACGSAPSDPGRFYVLSSPADIGAGKSPQKIELGVGPVTLPQHLDRSQIVTQATRNRLQLENLDQWAEPLKDGFARVLAQNLSALLGSDAIFQYPLRRPFTVQYQIAIHVQRFDTDATGNSVLTARWDVIRGDGRELIYSRLSTYKSKVNSPGLEPVVAAMSANLAELSREIATGLAALVKR